MTKLINMLWFIINTIIFLILSMLIGIGLGQGFESIGIFAFLSFLFIGAFCGLYFYFDKNLN